MIYLAAPEGVTDLVKIGFTSGPAKKRVAGLQTGSPYALEIIATIDGDQRRETLLHAIFQEHRTRGEWFRVSPDEAIQANAILDVDRMEAMLTLSGKQLARLSALLETDNIKDTFLLGMTEPDFAALMESAKKRPKMVRSPSTNKGGRPKSRPKDAAYLGLWVSRKVLDKADAVAASEGKTRSEIIRARLAAAFEKE